MHNLSIQIGLACLKIQPVWIKIMNFEPFGLEPTSFYYASWLVTIYYT